jgi:hypothetical protein
LGLSVGVVRSVCIRFVVCMMRSMWYQVCGWSGERCVVSELYGEGCVVVIVYIIVYRL